MIPVKHLDYALSQLDRLSEMGLEEIQIPAPPRLIFAPENIDVPYSEPSPVFVFRKTEHDGWVLVSWPEYE